ncbi:MAG: hypothetical protein LBD84_00845 [Campylobacteraceae bacterium]|jgi:hypothetical protein|nr:hypothetical protein [Campylobacteraceae bacterium]
MEGKKKQIRKRIVGRQTKMSYYWTFDVRQYLDFLASRIQNEIVIANVYFQNNTINISNDNCDIQFVWDNDNNNNNDDNIVWRLSKEQEAMFKEQEAIFKKNEAKIKENDAKIKALIDSLGINID